MSDSADDDVPQTPGQSPEAAPVVAISVDAFPRPQLKPPTYSGKLSEDPNEFRERWMEYQTSTRLSEEAARAMLPSALTELAWTVYNEKKRECSSVQEVLDALVRSFDTEHVRSNFLLEVMNTKYVPGSATCVTEFATKVDAKLRRAGVQDAHQRAMYFLHTLPRDAQVDILRTRGSAPAPSESFATFTNAVCAAESFYALRPGNTAVTVANIERRSGTKRAGPARTLQECWECGRRGHMARDCWHRSDAAGAPAQGRGARRDKRGRGGGQGQPRGRGKGSRNGGPPQEEVRGGN